MSKFLIMQRLTLALRKRGTAIRLQRLAFWLLRPVTVTLAIIPAFCQATPLAAS